MADGLVSMGEFGVVELFQKTAGPVTGANTLGIGDDCAVLSRDDPAEYLLLTTDALVERVHFLRDQISARQLGYKSLAVSLSDIAAMGGIPEAAFLSLGLTRDIKKSWIEAFSDGFLECANEFGAQLMGGDTVASKQDIFINVSVTGKCKSNEPIRRDGAKAGDIIYLGRPTGDSAAGLYLLSHETPGLQERDKGKLLAAHLTPEPQLGLGQLLCRENLASAMIDISDGLLQDLDHVCKASGLGAHLDSEDIPISPQLKSLGALEDYSPLDWALSGGEDYCLLFCVHRDLATSTETMCKKELGIRIHRIGTMLHGQTGIRLLKDGRSMEPGKTGYDHFSKYPTD